MIITESDVNRRARIFDRPGGKGLIGVVTQVEGNSFRFRTNSGREYVFSTEGKLAVQVQFLESEF